MYRDNHEYFYCFFYFFYTERFAKQPIEEGDSRREIERRISHLLHILNVLRKKRQKCVIKNPISAWYGENYFSSRSQKTLNANKTPYLSQENCLKRPDSGRLWNSASQQVSSFSTDTFMTNEVNIWRQIKRCIVT